MTSQRQTLPVGAAGGGGPVVVPPQRRRSGFCRIWERLVVLDDTPEDGAAAPLHPLQVDHVRRDARQLVGHADLSGTAQTVHHGATPTDQREKGAELRTSCWLQTARSETFPQPTGTTSKQRSGSQPKTRRESEAPLKRQEPSGLNRRHLGGRGHWGHRGLPGRGQRSGGWNSPDGRRVSFQRAHLGELLQVPELDAPAGERRGRITDV